MAVVASYSGRVMASSAGPLDGAKRKNGLDNSKSGDILRPTQLGKAGKYPSHHSQLMLPLVGS